MGFEEIASVQDPLLSVYQTLHCLSRLLLGQLHVVVPEDVDPLVQKAIGAGHLDLLSDEVSLHLSTLEVGRPMVVDRWVIFQPLHDFFFLSWSEGPLLVILPRKTPKADMSPSLLEDSAGAGGGGGGSSEASADAAVSGEGWLALACFLGDGFFSDFLGAVVPGAGG